jgi:predicted DNA repair protein MutK
MAGASLLTLIDDIATVLDDVAVMSKLAVKKTAGVLGDDLALNAQQVAGVKADRELPVVWTVAKGSFVNKLILVPAALAISAFIPWAIMPLLMIGGLFLCYEGFEKIAHKLLHSAQEDKQHHHKLIHAITDSGTGMVAFERDKIKGAIRTDFILSAEIIVITLGTVTAAPFGKQVAVLSTIAIIMTIGVYGLVAGIVKLDDAGLYLSRKNNQLQHKLGMMLLGFAPWLMKFLSVAGAAAMFLVGGGILVHGISVLHHGVQHLTQQTGSVAGIGPALEFLTPVLMSAVAGIVAGGMVVGITQMFKRFRSVR